jgi:hypothetical protein
MFTGAQEALLDRLYIKPKPVDPPSNISQRKPRMFATFDLKKGGYDYSLDFCLWLHRNFDGLVHAINTHTLFEFDTW